MKLERTEYIQTSKGTIPVYADEIVEQPLTYAKEDHHTWSVLFHRQYEHVKALAHPLFLRALQDMHFGDAIPRFDEISQQTQNWDLVAVNGLLSDVAFFNLLKHKKFPVTWWIRKPHQLDYIQEPDMFHDLFGHVPMLSQPFYADLMQEFGELGSGIHSTNPKFMEQLSRLYWYSVEFGLMRTVDQGKTQAIKAFGAGLLSSQGEIHHALEAQTQKKSFKQNQAAHTPYRIDAYQPLYFVSNDLQDVLHEIRKFARKWD